MVSSNNPRDLTADLLALEESEDFWAIARNEVLLRDIKDSPVLDVGCGTGEITKELIKKNLEVYSIDIDERACENTRKYNLHTFCFDFTLDKANNFPKFKVAVLADSLEHMKDDLMAMQHLNHLLNNGGKVRISVPCSQKLWTLNDTSRLHFRRYSKNDLRQKLEQSGFKVLKIKYWNLLSVPPIVMAKIFSYRIPHEKISSSRMNNLLKWYFLKIENKLPLFFGSELICEAEKVREV